MDVPYDVAEYISNFLDPTSAIRLAYTCKEYFPFTIRARRQMRREEVLRCTTIISRIHSSLESGDYVIRGNRDYDPRMDMVLDFLWFNKKPTAYEWVDPELYKKLHNGDIPTLWKFSKKVYETTLGIP